MNIVKSEYTISKKMQLKRNKYGIDKKMQPIKNRRFVRRFNLDEIILWLLREYER